MLKFNEAVAERLQARREGEKGFTLIELLVVVIIIGVLAAIAIPVFLNQRESAWRSSVEADLRSAALGIESFAAKNNGSIADLTITAFAEGQNDLGDDISVTVSPGNSITFEEGAEPNSYILRGTNENLDDEFVYDSQLGGIQPPAED